ncbi:SCO family protein [Solimonas marina]|uniref:SCO family protein n=1 Tax=Solimonas marina TaxID=2714601 RepID=A0A969WDN6_9GAMM|nr:SCO family protein [Solimonas marina]NKF24078.1 SCO family protein [Solimonas marina]
MLRHITLALFALAVLGGCHQQQTWKLKNVRHLLPDLKFTMQRAGDDKTVTAADYRGKTVLLYFGYTHCPDICPTTLARLRAVLHGLGADAAKVQVLFVSVDPQRDDDATLAQYVHAFDPAFDGLRGSPAQLAALAKRYRVGYTKQGNEPDGGYTMSHSSAVFIFDRAGHARLLGDETAPVDAFDADLKQLLAG